MSTPTNFIATVPASDELDDSQLEAIAGGFLDATLGSSVLGDGMLCIGGGLMRWTPISGHRGVKLSGGGGC